LWLCPFKLGNKLGLVNSLKSDDDTSMYVDIGAYGVPLTPNFDARLTTRRIEEFVRKVGG
jgi:hypothetical protein